jgi:hypothetical protein
MLPRRSTTWTWGKMFIQGDAMGPGSAIAAALLAAGVTNVGGRTLQQINIKRVRPRNGAKRRNAKRRLKASAG